MTNKNDYNMKHCPRCNQELDEACYTYGLKYCGSCIDKRSA